MTGKYAVVALPHPTDPENVTYRVSMEDVKPMSGWTFNVGDTVCVPPDKYGRGTVGTLLEMDVE